MTDVFSREKRSEVMSRIRGKNTAPELKVRSMLHRMGYRFRLHVTDLPGIPDIVLPKYKTVIFVHGCFWHQHNGCKLASIPQTNRHFWIQKLKRNILHDGSSMDKLSSIGWHVVVIWECEIEAQKNLEAFQNLLVEKLTHDLME